MIKKYTEDLNKASVNWRPYEKCTEVQYYNQEMNIMSSIIELLKDKTILERHYVNEPKNKDKELLFISYEQRCRGKKREELIEEIRERLKKYDYLKHGEIEAFILENIPNDYLTAYNVLNRLGKNWTKVGEKKEAITYIYELCMERNVEKDILDELIELLDKELDIYKNEYELGKFIDNRIRYRSSDIYRKRNGYRSTSRKVPKNGEITMENIAEDSLRILRMSQVGTRKDLQKNTYVVEGEKIYFSMEDVGKTVRIKYRRGEKELYYMMTQMEKVRIKESNDKDEAQAKVALAAKIINFKKLRKNEGKIERRQICFTEKLAYCIKRGYREEKNFEVDSARAVEKLYLDFFMSEPCLPQEIGFFQRIENVPLKSWCDIPYLKDKRKKQLNWNAKGWLPAKVPIGYFEELQKKKISNATVTKFRKSYENDEWFKEGIIEMGMM